MSSWRIWLPALAVSFAAFVLKRHYAGASPEELRWILAPTAALTGFMLREKFIWQAGAGYLSPDLSIVIAKPCAGVNFMIVAFVTLAIGFTPRFSEVRRRALWTALALALAYVATVIANTGRITCSVVLAHQAARSLGLSFQAAHRVLGVIVYLLSLLGLVLGTDFAIRNEPISSRWPLALGFGAYLGLTVIVPFVGGAGALPEYREHALAVVLSSTAVAALAAAIYAVVRFARRPARPSRHCILPPIPSGSPLSR